MRSTKYSAAIPLLIALALSPAAAWAQAAAAVAATPVPGWLRALPLASCAVSCALLWLWLRERGLRKAAAKAAPQGGVYQGSAYAPIPAALLRPADAGAKPCGRQHDGHCRDIRDSISYGKRIQRAMLPAVPFDSPCPSFVFYQPRDVVSGDFYFYERHGRLQIFAVADCTGHGVPGAFMSMLGISNMHEVIVHRDHSHPGRILDALREVVIRALRQREAGDGPMDGMDMSVVILDADAGRLQFAGANAFLYLVPAGGQLRVVRGDRQPLSLYPDMRPFGVTTLDVAPGDTFYLSTDGFRDQFGGPEGRKMGTTQFRALLERAARDRDMDRQRMLLADTFDRWRGNAPQVDDVTVMGVRVERDNRALEA